ncbi:MAG: hypothetical protein WBH76_08025 [Dictyoglomaceae bacterium]
MGERLYDALKNEEPLLKEKFDDLLKELTDIETKISDKQKEIEEIAKEEKLEPEDVSKIPAIVDEEKED